MKKLVWIMVGGVVLWGAVGLILMCLAAVHGRSMRALLISQIIFQDCLPRLIAEKDLERIRVFSEETKYVIPIYVNSSPTSPQYRIFTDWLRKWGPCSSN